MRLGTETGSLVNHIYSRSTINEPKPEIGMGVTVLMWTDRAAGTIIELYTDGGFTVQLDHAKRIDSNGMSECQEYEYSPNPNGGVLIFEPVKRGNAKGQIRENGKKDGRGVLLGVRRHYYDFSF